MKNKSKHINNNIHYFCLTNFVQLSHSTSITIFVTLFIICSGWRNNISAQTNSMDIRIKYLQMKFGGNLNIQQSLISLDSLIEGSTDSLLQEEGSIGPQFDALKSYINKHLDDRGTLKSYAVKKSGLLSSVCNDNGNWKEMGTDKIIADVGSGDGYGNGIMWKIWAEPNPNPDDNSPYHPQLIYAGGEGGLWKTLDGGQNWKCVTSNSGYGALNVQSIAVNPLNHDQVYIGEGSGTGLGAFYSMDGGNTWNRDMKILPLLPIVYGVSSPDIIVPQTHVFASPNSGIFYCSANNLLWRRSPATGDWTQILDEKSVEGKMVTVGASATILNAPITSSGFGVLSGAGVSISPSSSSQLNSTCMVSPQVGYAVGNGALILKTTDGGVTWLQQSPPTGITANLNSVHFFTELQGWAVGDNGIIIKTVDGGTNWTDGSLLIPFWAHAINFRGVHFVQNNVGFVVGSSGTILFTEDGLNWTSQTAPTGTPQLNAVYFSSTSVGYAVGNAGTILKTSNGGQTWLNYTFLYGGSTFTTTSSLNGLYFLNSDYGFIVGDGGLVIKHDGNAAIKDVPSFIGSGDLYGAYCTGYSNTIVVGANHMIAQSTDGGVTWSTSTGGSDLKSISAVGILGADIIRAPWDGLLSNPITNITFLDGINTSLHNDVLFVQHQFSTVIRIVDDLTGSPPVTKIALRGYEDYNGIDFALASSNSPSDLYILTLYYSQQKIGTNPYYQQILHYSNTDPSKVGDILTDVTNSKEDGLLTFSNGNSERFTTDQFWAQYAPVAGRDGLYPQFIVSKARNTVGKPIFYVICDPPIKSVDGGANFTLLDPSNYGIHKDPRSMILASSSSSDPSHTGAKDVIVFANDGGVSWKPSDVLSAHYSNIVGKGLTIAAFQHIAVSENDATYLAGGMTHDGTLALVNGIWHQLGFGDATSAFCDDYEIDGDVAHSNNAIIQNDILTSFGNLDSKSDFGLSLSTNLNFSGISLANKPIAFAANRTDVYVGYDEIKKLSHSGTDVIQAGNVTDIIAQHSDLTGYPILSFDVAKDGSGNEIVYVLYDVPYSWSAGYTKRLIKYVNGVATPITNGLPNLYASRVVVNPANSNEIWVSFYNYYTDASGALQDNTNKVWYNNDAGAASNWVDRSQGLSNMPVNTMAYRRGSNDEIYLGNDIGVWVWKPTYNLTSHNDLAAPSAGQWICFNKNLPGSEVLDLQINNCASKLRVSLNSHGVWESDLPAQEEVTETWGDVYGSNSIINAGRLTPDPNHIYQDLGSVYSGTSSSPKITNHIHHDIELFGDGTATISYATLRFDKGYGLKVGTGVKLVLNHCTLESACNCSWDGINVKGNTCESQDLYSDGTPMNQGFLYLDHSTIRDAKVAASIYDQTAYDWGGGGIIQAVTSTFENNQQAVGFMKYPHDAGDWGAGQCLNLNIPQTNKSFFKNCTFQNSKVLNDNMRFQRFVSMWGVNQVHFTACKFENQTGFTDQFTQSNSYTPNQLGYGIYTEDANFIVDGVPPLAGLPGTGVHSSFKNLNYGILATLGQAHKSLIVQSTDFINNKQGLALSGTNNSTVQYNTFSQLGNFPYNSTLLSTGGVPLITNTGLSVIGSKQFAISDNCFSSAFSCTPPALQACPTYNTTFGAWYYNNGAPSLITNSNHFSNVPTAEYAQGSNTNSDGSTGLGFRSNWHDNSTYYDLAVWDGGAYNTGTYQFPVLPLSSGTIPSGGICKIQGGERASLFSYYSAGNYFSDLATNSSATTRDINWPVSTQQNILYYTRNAQLPTTNPVSSEFPFNTTSNVTRSTLNVVPSAYSMYYCSGEPSGPGIHLHTPWINITDYEHIKIPFELGIKPQIIDIFSAAHALHTTSINNLKAYVDGGSSDNELKMITDAGSGDMSEVYSTLISHSPYLSEQTGVAVANATTLFPPEYRYAILAANPDILRDNKILNIVINQDPPMDDSLINNLIDLQDSVTDRTLLEATINASSIDMHEAVQFLITDITLDSIGIDHSAICGWLDSLQEPEADMMIADDLMGRGLYDSARARIDSISGRYDIDSSQMAAITSYRDLITYFSTASSSGVRFDSIFWHYADSATIDPINAYDPPYPSADVSLASTNSGTTGGSSGSSTTCGLSLVQPYIHQCRTDSAISVDHTVHDLYFNLHYTGRFQSPVTFSAPGKKIVKQTVSRLGAYTPVHLEILDSPSLAWSYRVIATAYDSTSGPCSIPISVDSAGMNNIAMLDSCGFTYSFLIDSILSDDGHEHVTTHFVATVFNPLDKAVDIVIMPQVSSQMQAINYTRAHIGAEDSLIIGGSFWQKDTLPGTVHFMIAAIDSASDTLCMTDVYFDNAIQHNSGLWRASGGITSAPGGGGSGGSGGSHGGSGGDTDTTTHTPVFGSIQEIADRGAGPAALRARNFLKFFFHENYEDLPVLPVDKGTKMATLQKPQKRDLAKSSRVRVYPNPGNDLVTLDYRLADNSEAATLLVINSMGQQILSTNMPGSTGTRQIDTRQFPGGLYLYRVTSQRGYTSSGSFIITH